MVFLSDFIKDKSRKIGIVVPTATTERPAVNTEFRYKSQYILSLKNQLINNGYRNVSIVENISKDNLLEYDEIIFINTISTITTFNVFFLDKFISNLANIFTLKDKKVFVYKIPIPSFIRELRKRVKTDEKYQRNYFKNELVNAINDKLKSSYSYEEIMESLKNFESNYVVFDFVDRNPNLIVGDSHSLAIYRSDYILNMNPGLLLFTLINNKIKNYIYPEVKNLMIFAGNIDIRFHLSSRENPLESIDSILTELESQLLELNLDSVTLVHVFPIETESRIMNTNMCYKGKPFIGSWKLRTDLVNYFNQKISEICSRNSWKVIEWPEFLKNSKNELCVSRMELRAGPHLNEYFYYWNMKQNKKNPLYEYYENSQTDLVNSFIETYKCSKNLNYLETTKYSLF